MGPDSADRFLTTAEAARFLGVRKETLYAYVSRGWLSRHGGPRSRGSSYLKSELERLKARHDARAGHAPVAGAALRWGEPVLDSAITGIDERGPRYRGHVAVDLALAHTPFESVAELLWTGTLPPRPPRFEGSAATTDERDPFRAFAIVLTELHGRARAPDVGGELTFERGREALAALASHSRPGGGSIARRLARSLRVAPTEPHLAALDAALVLCADHELNASSFAARIAASTGAELHACLLAALHTASGPKHGGASARVEALLVEIAERGGVSRTLAERLRQGDAIPGFGHPLYRGGDPRAVPLFALAKKLAPRNRELRVLLAASAKIARARRELPNVDAALVALMSALGAASGSAQTVFVLGRVAGWVAHVAEQRAAGFILRPRARYVGP